MSYNKTVSVWLKIWLFLFPFVVFSQNNVGLKFFGLSIHPKGEAQNAHLMPNKLDRNAYLVMNLGAEISYEYFLLGDMLSAKAIQGIYADCAAEFGGFSHIGLRGRIFKTHKHSLYGGIGPTLIFRRNWLRLEGYQNPEFFNGNINDDFQWKFLWYGGEFEYKYYFSEKWSLAVSFVPGYPDLMSLAVGVSFCPF